MSLAPVLDVIALLVRWFAPMAIGAIHTNGGARLRRDSETSWTIGRADDSYDRQGQLGDVVETVEGDAQAVARRFAVLHPKAAEFIRSGEESRLRFHDECMVRNIAYAEVYRDRTTRLNALVAMAKAGVSFLWVAEAYTEQGAWGDTEGYAVYAESQEAADQVAKWLCVAAGRPEYAARHFTGYARPGVPAAAFAAVNYYSIGD